MHIQKDANLSKDTFLNSQIITWQFKNGYRYSVDSILLASFYNTQKNDYIIDVGTGCGIISLLLCHWYPTIHITGVEIQSELAQLAIRNAQENQFSDRFKILQSDITILNKTAFPQPTTHIMANPPFYAVGRGRKNLIEQQLLARHEVCLTMQQLVDSAYRLLNRGGKFLSIYPMERWTEFKNILNDNKFFISRTCQVFAKQSHPPKLILVESEKEGIGGIKEETSIIMYQENGRYTDEMILLFSGVLPDRN